MKGSLIMKLSYDGHPLKVVTTKFCVDSAIYPILNWLWANYFKTEYSCQGGERTDNKFVDSYILFYKSKDAIWFYKFLTRSLGISAWLSRREYKYGGGCSVQFPHSALKLIAEELNKIQGFDYCAEVIEC